MSLYREYVLFSGAVGASASGEEVPLDFGTKEEPTNPDARAYLNVISLSGVTPSIIVSLSAVVRGLEFPLASFSAVTIASKQTITIPNMPKIVKVGFVVSGTGPNINFEVLLAK